MAGRSLGDARASQHAAYAKRHTQRDRPSRLPYHTQNAHVATTPSTMTSPETFYVNGLPYNPEGIKAWFRVRLMSRVDLDLPTFVFWRKCRHLSLN